MARMRYAISRATETIADRVPQTTRAGRPVVIYASLTRRWTCDGCGQELVRGTRVRITITAGAPRNLVEHDPPCRPHC